MIVFDGHEPGLNRTTGHMRPTVGLCLEAWLLNVTTSVNIKNTTRSLLRRKDEPKKAGKVRKGDGKDVDHKNRNTADNRRKNLRVQPKGKNRSFSRKKKK
jgi:hypothetical protein